MQAEILELKKSCWERLHSTIEQSLASHQIAMTAGELMRILSILILLLALALTLVWYE